MCLCVCVYEEAVGVRSGQIFVRSCIKAVASRTSAVVRGVVEK